MRRSALLIAALAVLAGAVVATGAAAQATAGGATASGDATPDSGATPGSSDVAPGARLSGVVGVQDAELRGSVDARSFAARVANASSADERAALVAERVRTLRERVDALERRRESLAAARANGSMDAGEYRARAARLHAESAAVEHVLARVNATARDLPAAALQAHGVDRAALATLRERAGAAGGGEVAAAARQIAGQNAGRPVGAGPPGAHGGGPGADHGAPNGTGGPGAGDAGSGPENGNGP
ncbi:MAG: hypothetical protein ABEJ89_01080 [Haloarculaceae archaeon]